MSRKSKKEAYAHDEYIKKCRQDPLEYSPRMSSERKIRNRLQRKVQERANTGGNE